MSDVFKTISEKTKKFGIKNVLVVFDIDNTILTMKNDLGSDQWFSWQEKIIFEEKCEPFCITKNFNELLEAQELLFEIGEMAATETELPTLIEEWQKKGLKFILLTSRGSSLRSVTEKELARNGYSFADSSIGPQFGFAGVYLPYDIQNPKKMNLTKDEVVTAGLKEAKPVSFQNGIYMTSGQNKGIMLKTLLKKLNIKFQSIVFADDHQKHTDRMHAIMGDEADVVSFRYGKMDPQVEAFHKSDKKAVTKKWNKLKESLKDAGF